MIIARLVLWARFWEAILFLTMDLIHNDVKNKRATIVGGLLYRVVLREMAFSYDSIYILQQGGR